MKARDASWYMAFGCCGEPGDGKSKVYVVTAGEYDAYRVVAMCSSKEKAEQFINDNRKHLAYWDSFNEIDEWSLDPEVP